MTVEDTRKIADANARKRTATIEGYIDALNRILAQNQTFVDPSAYNRSTLLASEYIEMNGVDISYTKSVIKRDRVGIVYNGPNSITYEIKEIGRPHVHSAISAIYEDGTVEELTWHRILELRVRYQMILARRSKTAA